MENSMEVPQKTKNGFVIWSRNPTPGDISRENHNLERYMQLYVHCSTIYNRQDMKATYRSTDRWMDKDVVYTNNRILLSHKKNGTMPFSATWMDLEIIILSEIRQKEKDKYHMISIMWNLTWHKWTYLPNRNRLTQRIDMVAKAVERWGRDWLKVWD